jgi:hypothetical protein
LPGSNCFQKIFDGNRGLILETQKTIQSPPAMKTHLLLASFWIAIIGAFLCSSAPAFGDELLNQALDLVHQALNPGGDRPSNDDRTTWLTKALDLAQKSPVRNAAGHRVKAMHDIQAALDAIKQNSPDNEVSGYIRDAYSELRTATSLTD